MLSPQSYEREGRSIDRLLARMSSQMTQVDPNSDVGRAEIFTLLTTAREELDFHKRELSKYLDNCPDQLDIATVEERYDSFRSDMLNIIARYNVLLSGVPPRPAAPNPAAHSTRVEATFDNHTVMNNTTCSQIKVPKFNLPCFEGNFTQWENFWATFDTLINQSVTLSKIEKFEYLLGYLKGPALSVVDHLDFKEANYETAISLLKERFSNPRRTLSWHSNGLLNLPSVTGSVSSIRAFLDKYNTHFYSLKNHSAQINVYEVVFASYVLSKFSFDLRDKFEAQLETTEELHFPTSEQITTFLNSHVTKLENTRIDSMPSNSSFHASTTTASSSRVNSSNKNNKKSSQSQIKSISSCATSIETCPLCNATGHLVNSCSVLLEKTPQQRYTLIKSKNLCVSCLLSKHKGRCRSRQPCQQCNSAGHHTLLHFGSSAPVPSLLVSPEATPGTGTSQSTEATTLVVNGNPPEVRYLNVLMATCLVKLKVTNSKYVVVRAILDSASHVSFISEYCAQMLGCARFAAKNQIKGVGSATTSSNGLTQLSVGSVNGYTLAVDHPFVILNKITGLTPCIEVSSTVKEKVKNLVLADPTFGTPAPIDCLLGADLTAKAFKGQSFSFGDEFPVAVDTHFGYVLMGSSPVSNDALLVSALEVNSTLASFATSIDDDLLQAVQNFWSLEEPPQCSKSSPEDLACEKYYEETTTRLPCGRYQVRIPFKRNPHHTLGASQEAALNRFKALERRFRRDPHFKELYVEFMADYKLQGHMKTLPANHGPPKFLLPHHGIFKVHGDSKKIRVVFDGSVKTTSGVSLNDILYSGPKLQPLISDVITSFRFFKFAFICDIEQMFRQIRIHPEDVSYQCILWRDHEDWPIATIGLETVTYGTASAPYLALLPLPRCRRKYYQENCPRTHRSSV